MIRNLAGALALFARQTRQTFAPQPRMTAHVPEFPLRCQHCPASIQLLANSVPLYHDETGRFFCDSARTISHRPMPSVLG
jgi:hypothetical protein